MIEVEALNDGWHKFQLSYSGTVQADVFKHDLHAVTRIDYGARGSSGFTNVVCGVVIRHCRRFPQGLRLNCFVDDAFRAPRSFAIQAGREVLIAHAWTSRAGLALRRAAMPLVGWSNLHQERRYGS